MNELKKYNEIIFENIKHVDEYGNEFWYARELQIALDYKEWRNFIKVIKRAQIACSKSNNDVNFNFDVNTKKGVSTKTVTDYKLSRFACYLIVQNADSRKKAVALSQTYFAVQTRKQEKRNKKDTFDKTVENAGVKDKDKFYDAGYKGLYNGETANDIAKRKGLQCGENILDNMCIDELAINLFFKEQIEAKLKRECVKDEKTACKIHEEVGKTIREAIKEMGGTMPEDLPTPKKV